MQLEGTWLSAQKPLLCLTIPLLLCNRRLISQLLHLLKINSINCNRQLNFVLKGQWVYLTLDYQISSWFPNWGYGKTQLPLRSSSKVPSEGQGEAIKSHREAPGLQGDVPLGNAQVPHGELVRSVGVQLGTALQDTATHSSSNPGSSHSRRPTFLAPLSQSSHHVLCMAGKAAEQRRSRNAVFLSNRLHADIFPRPKLWVQFEMPSCRTTIMMIEVLVGNVFCLQT